MKTDNELIAEFMGAERREGQRAFNPDQKIVQWIIKGNPYNQHRDDIMHWYQPVELKYHESWDWFMPVVEKIERALSQLGASDMAGWDHWNDQFDGTINTDIRVAYQIVVEFIKWYNQQKQ